MCIRSSGTEKPSIWIPSETPSKRKRIRACNGRRRNSNGKAGDFMPYIPPEVVEQARQIDLLTYLQSCEPQELVRISGNNYTTRTHDSLKISNGKWMWWSQRIGGYNALDYLVKVKGCSFVEAVASIDKGTRGSAGRKCPHTASKPLRIHKVFSAAFSLSASISAPAELLRIGQPWIFEGFLFFWTQAGCRPPRTKGQKAPKRLAVRRVCSC